MSNTQENHAALEAYFAGFIGQCKCKACEGIKGLTKIKVKATQQKELIRIVDIALKDKTGCHFSNLVKKYYRVIESQIKEKK